LADRVIVVGATRGNQKVPASEISQMIGRAGRKHDGDECLATVVVEQANAEQLMSDMEAADSHVVSSTLADKQSLAFHVLPEICSGDVRRPEDAESWYSRSLGATQGVGADFQAAFKMLEENSAISTLSGRTVATELGKISSRFYFHSSDVCAWRDSFTKVFDLGLECNDFAIAWALASAPVMRMSGDFGKHWEAVQMYKDGLPPGLDGTASGVVTGTLWWHVLGGPPVGKMKNIALTLRGDVGRIGRALVEIDARVSHWQMVDFFEEMVWRAKHGVPSALAFLCKIPGISKGRAAYLHSLGITDKEGIRSSISELEGEVEGPFLTVLKEIADGVR